MNAARTSKHKVATKGRLQERASMVKPQEHGSVVGKKELAKAREGTKVKLLAKVKELTTAKERADGKDLVKPKEIGNTKLTKAKELPKAKEHVKMEQLEKAKELARAQLRITKVMLKAKDQPRPTARELERERQLEKLREIFTFVRNEADNAIFYSVVDKETITNEKLIEFKKDLQAMESRANRVLEENKRQELEEFWNDRDKRARQKCPNKNSFYEYNLNQIKEKEQLQEVQRQQAKEERDKASHCRDLYARELEIQEERKDKSKKKLFQQIREDILDKNKHREMVAQNAMVEEEKAKYMQLDMDEKEQQKKLEHARRLQKHQLLIDVASDKYAVVIMRQAISPTWRNKVQLFKD